MPIKIRLHHPLLSLLLLASATSVNAQNLLLNPGAELNAIADNVQGSASSTNVLPTHWNRLTGNFEGRNFGGAMTAVTKNNVYWVTSWPKVGPGVSSNFFVAGRDWVSGSPNNWVGLYQDISFADHLPAIQDQSARMTFQARVGGFQNQGDNTQFLLIYQDANGAETGRWQSGSTAHLVPHINEGNGVAGFQAGADYDLNLGLTSTWGEKIPTGTVRGRFYLIGEKRAGGDNDAYADDLNLQVVPEPATLVGFGIGALFLRRRNRAK